MESNITMNKRIIRNCVVIFIIEFSILFLGFNNSFKALENDLDTGVSIKSPQQENTYTPFIPCQAINKNYLIMNLIV